MKKVMKYPIYPITLSFVHGIFCGLYFPLSPIFLLICGVIALAVFTFLHFKQQKNTFRKSLNYALFICLYVIFFTIGSLNTIIHNKHDVAINLNEIEFTVEIDEVLKANDYANRVYGRLISEKEKPKVVISFAKQDSLLKVGEVYKIIGSIKEIAPPKNPYDFNYQKYLVNKRIFYQITTYHSSFKIGENPTIKTFIIHQRNEFIERFSKMNYDRKTVGFIEALLFGIKNNLDTNVQNQFKELGVMHVLAVSGMHVVLLFGTISYVLRKIKLRQYVIDSILVAFLIIFCCMSGFSGSVLRAALMCIMVLIANYTNKGVSTINLLVGSMFLILLFEPNYLVDVGFQLSYLAVFSIVFCYPLIQKYFTFKNCIINYFGQLVGISLVAQLGVLPLSIYYFNQIPLLFLLGNLIAIPMTSFLLIGWFLQLFLSFISIELASYITYLLQAIAKLCFNSVNYISTSFNLKTVQAHLNLFDLLMIFILLFCLFWYFYKRTIAKIYICLASIIGFQLSILYQKYTNSNTLESIILYDTKNVVFLHNQHRKVDVIGNGSDFTEKSITNYLLHNNAKMSSRDSVKNAFTINNNSWLLIDSLSVYPNRKFDYVIISEKASIHIERLLVNTQPKMIILHSTLPVYLTDFYRKYLDEKRIPYYDMRSKGAYVEL